MQYIQETRLADFPAWSGAKDTLDAICRAGKISQAEEYLADIFCGRVPTATEINDILWFDAVDILNFCGVEDAE